MIDGLRPYADYRDAGVPWLGDVPPTWRIARNGSLFAHRNETGFGELPILEVSLKTGVRVRNLGGNGRKQVMADREKYKRACKGDLAYNMMRMWQGAVGLAPVDGLVSPAYVVARPLTGVEPRYFEYLFRTEAYMGEVAKFSHGIVKDRNRLYWEEFKQMPSPVPPPKEQAAIVRFLDHEDRRIRRCIRAKQKLIELLEKQKQAIIHRAVTRGLDPNVRLKPSGVEWLGDVPEHWGVVALKRSCSLLRDGTHLPPSRQPTGIPLLSVRNIVAGTFTRRDDDSLISHADYEQLCRSFVLQVNDVLLAIVGATLGKVAIVEEMGQFHIQRSLAVLRAKPETLSHEFLAAFLRGPGFQRALWTTVAFSAQPGIYLNTLGNFMVLIPPLREQERIMGSLASGCERLDQAIATAHREVSLLHEYRTRLIADVVTGKVDVRDAAARLPNEAEELESLDEAETMTGAEGDAAGDLDAGSDEAEV